MAGHSKWANIKHRKGRQDALRAKITTKVGREITIAVKIGGADPALNMKLKLALQKAKEGNIPKENIQRAIQKGLGGGDSADYEEIRYEGYGPGGVAVFLDALSDNRNRTAADVRHLFSKYGGNLGEIGSVAWMFDAKGVFVIEETGSSLSEDDLMMLVLEAGAEDLESQDGAYEITTSPESFDSVLKALEDANIEPQIAQVTMVPQTTMSLSQEQSEKMIKLLEALEEHDDVQNVYSNFEIPDEE